MWEAKRKKYLNNIFPQHKIHSLNYIDHPYYISLSMTIHPDIVHLNKLKLWKTATIMHFSKKFWKISYLKGKKKKIIWNSKEFTIILCATGDLCISHSWTAKLSVTDLALKKSKSKKRWNARCPLKSKIFDFNFDFSCYP